MNLMVLKENFLACHRMTVREKEHALLLDGAKGKVTAKKLLPKPNKIALLLKKKLA